MRYKQLGSTAYRVSELAMGCVTFGREIDEDASCEILDHAFQHGINFLDTAEAYGGTGPQVPRDDCNSVHSVQGAIGASESILGRWMRSRGCRDQAVLCTKVSSGTTPEVIRRALESSLERLQTDRVDLYEIHSPDDSVPLEDSLGCMFELVDRGLVGAIGVSNFDPEQLLEAMRVSHNLGGRRIDALQTPYSLVAPESEKLLFPMCAENDIAITTYSPLAAGFLTGKYTPNRNAIPAGTRFDIKPAHADLYFNDRGFRMVDQLRALSEDEGVSMAHLAVGWALGCDSITSVLVGARTKAHLDNALNVYASPLSPNLRNQINDWVLQ